MQYSVKNDTLINAEHVMHGVELHILLLLNTARSVVAKIKEHSMADTMDSRNRVIRSGIRSNHQLVSLKNRGTVQQIALCAVRDPP